MVSQQGGADAALAPDSSAAEWTDEPLSRDAHRDRADTVPQPEEPFVPLADSRGQAVASGNVAFAQAAKALLQTQPTKTRPGLSASHAVAVGELAGVAELGISPHNGRRTEASSKTVESAAAVIL